MTENDKKRGLEIRFFLIVYDITRITNPMDINNVLNFFDFFEKIDFTKSVNYDIIKSLAQTILTENTNLQPNKVELCNFCYTHGLRPKHLKKYVNITKPIYNATINRIQTEEFYQPTHLQPHVYAEIEKFLKLWNKFTDMGVEKSI